MRITTKSKYGMRMIVEIAAQPEGKAASLKAIARKINASEKYLEQIVIPLTKAGYLKSLRGANGGYVMGRSAEELTAHMVIAALEEKPASGPVWERSAAVPGRIPVR